MENKFNANRQVIFIEPTWVTGETCVFNIHNVYNRSYAMSKLSKIRKDFISRLEKEGFIITYDKNYNEDEVISLIMNDTAICNDNEELNIYKKTFDKRIFESGGEKLNYPYSLTVKEYFKNPFFPSVFKNELLNGGKDKFLIETPEQLEKIKKLYTKFYNDIRYKDAFDNSIFQQYIETPTNNKTYLRVLMSASGDVMGASLKYSKGSEKKREPQGLFEKHF